MGARNFNFIRSEDKQLVYQTIPAREKRLGVLLCLNHGLNPGTVASAFGVSRQYVWTVKNDYFKDGIKSFVVK